MVGQERNGHNVVSHTKNPSKICIFVPYNKNKIENCRIKLSASKSQFNDHIVSAILYWQMRVELRHDKTNKMSVRPVKTLIGMGIHPVYKSLRCALIG